MLYICIAFICGGILGIIVMAMCVLSKSADSYLSNIHDPRERDNSRPLHPASGGQRDR